MYHMVDFPQDQYRFKLYDNVHKYTMEKIKQVTGCDSLVNLTYFNMATFANDSALMIDGVWKCQPKWHDYGICISKSGNMTVGTETDSSCDYAIGCPPILVNGENHNHANLYNNGWTYTGIKADGTVVVWINTKDNKMNTVDVEAKLKAKGCVSIFRWDGSWSSQAVLQGQIIKPSQHRYCRSWLLVYKREIYKQDDKQDKENVKMKTVVIDAGHGVEEQANRSPDASYYEHEFAYDMSHRIQKLLERHGVNVVLTRHNEHTISLKARSDISNKANPDLFVSLHSNAFGNGDWVSPEGYEVYTSSPGDYANRNKLAKAIVNRAKEAGIKLHGKGLNHAMFYVLRNTNAPAVLIEHGFHTNKKEVEMLKTSAYRDKLAEVDVKGILDYLGIKWVEKKLEPIKPTEPTEPIKPTIPDWRKEFDDAWKEATDKGIVDGSRPNDNITRNELVVILKRCKAF